MTGRATKIPERVALAASIIGPKCNKTAVENAVRRLARKHWEKAQGAKMLYFPTTKINKGQKRAVGQVAMALRRLDNAIMNRHLPEFVRRWDDLVALQELSLDRLRFSLEELAGLWLAAPRRSNPLKRMAAREAAALLEQQGFPLYVTRGGQFYRLAAALYGQRGADFYRHCCAVKRDRAMPPRPRPVRATST